MGKTTTTVTVCTCDFCNANIESKAFNIGHSNSGFAWISSPGGGVGISSGTELYFCSFDCLAAYLKNELMPESQPAEIQTAEISLE
jgi:hypothetical protein